MAHIEEPTDLDVLADAILNCDHVEIFDAVAPYLNARDHMALADKLDVCPVHHCDREICLDDNLRCTKDRA